MLITTINKNSRLYLILLMFILVMGLATATQQTLGKFAVNENVVLKQNCINSTYSNVTLISFPDGSYNNTDLVMTKSGDDYFYSFNYTSSLGQYFVYGTCNENGVKTNWVYDFWIGDELDVGKAIVYIALLLILVLGFGVSLMGLFKVEDYKGKLALYWVSHLLLLTISFIAWDVSADFLIGSTFLIGFFRIIFFVVGIAVFPMILLSIAWIFYIHTVNDDIKKLMEHGLEFDEASERVGRKRK